MKTKFANSVIILLLFCGIAEGQLSFYLHGGPNLSKPYNNLLRDLTNAETFYYFGIEANQKLSPQWNLINSASYIQKGFSLGTLPVYTRYSYLDIHPQIAYLLGKNIWIQSGPYIGFKLSEAFKNGNDPWITQNEFQTIKVFDFGFSIGMRWYVDKFFVGLGASRGLLDINDVIYTNSNGEQLEGIKIINVNFKLELGFRFYQERRPEADKDHNL